MTKAMPSAAALKSCSLAVLAALAALAGPAARPAAGEEPRVRHKPLEIGALYEFGYLRRGLFTAGTSAQAVLQESDWMDHFGAFLTQETIVDERLHLSAGIGGIFQFRKPENDGAGFFGHKRKTFFSGPTRTEAVYHFGDVAEPWLKLGLGMFPYKYNAEACNLGEYLFRSEAYPTITSTGGYAIVNSANAHLQGFKGNFKLGNLKADLLLYTQTNIAPLYDWSLAGIVDYTVADGLLNLGAGVNFQRLLQIRPSRTARREGQNAYFTYKGKDYVGLTPYYSNTAKFYQRQADTLSARDSAGNAARIAGYRALQAAWVRDGAVSDSIIKDTSASRPEVKYFSASAILLMGRFSLDVKKVLDVGIFGPEDLKLYGEVDLLGLVNYPVFYRNRSDRMPVMVGLNLPGFRILDLIAVQVETMSSPWMNNTAQKGRSNFNVPYVPLPEDDLMSRADYYDSRSRDDFKWSVLVKKTLLDNLTLSAQAASDHLRSTSSVYYYGPQFDHNEVTAFDDHWYWMAQISWGI